MATDPKNLTPKFSKENKILEEYPTKIEELENNIKEMNDCLSNPECYKQKGLEELYKNLQENEQKLDELLEIYLEVEEKKEELEKSLKPIVKP